ncbi:sorting nexin 13, partial [Cichlidogyrus casuarinus]
MYSAKIINSETMKDNYVSYTLLVTCVSGMTGRSTVWQVLRRFSNFDELHSLIMDKCGRIPQLKPPSKRFIPSKDFLERRRKELDDYLQVLYQPDLHARYPNMRFLAIDFLQPASYDNRRKAFPSKPS